MHHSQEDVLATGSADGVLGVWDKRQARALRHCATVTPRSCAHPCRSPRHTPAPVRTPRREMHALTCAVWEALFRPGFAHQLYTCAEACER